MLFMLNFESVMPFFWWLAPSGESPLIVHKSVLLRSKPPLAEAPIFTRSA
jgi:hypothetical protein